jgi:protein-tyrosine phosphatase
MVDETGDARGPGDLRLRGVVNFRDLGGQPIAGGHARRGRVFRSDSLAYVEPEDVEALVDRLGIRSVIDLRSDMERATSPLAALESAGVQVVSVPLVDPARPASIPLDIATVTLEGLYEFILETSGDRFVEAVRGVAEGQPVVVQCMAGKDRTGLVSAMVLGALGATDEVIIADYVLTAHAVDELISRARARVPGGVDALMLERFMTAEAETMLGVLGWIRDHHGSIGGYLAYYGLEASQLDALRASLVEPA